MTNYTKTSSFPVSAKKLFSWHEQEGAFERLSPPWENITLIRQDSSLKPGSEVHFKVQKGLFSIPWIAKHTTYDPPNLFIDIQLKGPFSKWIHEHQIEELDKSNAQLKDQVSFSTPFKIGNKFALNEIDRMFEYRHRVLQNDLHVQMKYPSKRLSVAVTEPFSMIGSTFIGFLKTAGHHVIPISFKTPIKAESLESTDAVIHFLNEDPKQSIQETRKLVKILNHLKKTPKVFISESSIRYYGPDLKTDPTEHTPSGKNPLSSIYASLEKEASLFQSGRCVFPRFGVPLSSSGGILKTIKPFFLFALGGVIGKGDQRMSWVALDDLIYSIYQMMIDHSFSGPINLCCPKAVTNREFTKILGHVLGRPTLLPIPEMAIKSIFGKSNVEIFLSNYFAAPKNLEKRGHHFYYPDLEMALRHTFGKPLKHDLNFSS